ncbi:NAD(P)/FAD-dependent oxidoreductase [Granulicoccus phenolivorans]|uniref:NAD(P)/FAD-dependent oxidoreductase n=1 Tax=Granulicoccus phenolivorans TaxID=266854 RepID=UPI0003FF3260|nr:NAD(P)/FAD-dependent oxidoreductase [Granulicoccus phenolivorans]
MTDTAQPAADPAKSTGTAIIIGAGPAGLTAAYELQERVPGITPIVFEASDMVGGISRTVNYKGNRIDIGGHRFFSKSDRVMNWWTSIMPIQDTPEGESFTLQYRGNTRELTGGAGADPETTDEVLLVRSRLSRIYYDRKFFNYPITLDATTIKNLGLAKMARIGFSYLKARLRPLPEKSLEEFYINRFGRELYNTFFKSYTEKVWGVPVNEIAPDWGAQRVKGLSVMGTLVHAGKKIIDEKIAPRLGLSRKRADLAQKDVETSLIEFFLYPKYGPGQMWETVARKVVERGGQVHLRRAVTELYAEAPADGQPGRITGVEVTDWETGHTERIAADHVFSTMPISELITAFDGVEVPEHVTEIATSLPYRDFLTVGVLLKQLKIRNNTDIPTKYHIVPDNWIYVQEPDVQVGRLQIFNNWSPWMVADEHNVWIGMEYFCDEGDEMWSRSPEEMAAFGIEELVQMDIIDRADVLDTTVLHMKKTYPSYFGSYQQLDRVRDFTDSFENLWLLGRNGQHHYNNADHSMLTAMEAVDNIASGRRDKSNVWEVNAEQDYHESK